MALSITSVFTQPSLFFSAEGENKCSVIERELNNTICNASSGKNKEIEAEPILPACTAKKIDIDLSSLALTALPDSLNSFSNIRKLSLQVNQLKGPLDLSGLHELRFLDLSDNQLTESPNLIACTRLRGLRLSNNQLSSPPQLTHCAHLQELYLSNNQLTSLLPFHKDCRLLRLFVDGNPKLSELPEYNYASNFILKIEGTQLYSGFSKKSLKAQQEKQTALLSSQIASQAFYVAPLLDSKLYGTRGPSARIFSFF